MLCDFEINKRKWVKWYESVKNTFPQYDLSKIKCGILTKIHPIFQRVRGSTFTDRVSHGSFQKKACEQISCR